MLKSIFKALLAQLILFAIHSESVTAQLASGDLWPDFGNDGIYPQDFGFNDNLNDVAYDSESDKIYATGVALSPSFLGELKVLALDLQGNPVAGFANNGVFTYTSPNESYGYVVIPHNDKLLVGGLSISLTTGYADMLLLRLNKADGTLDNTFGVNGVVIFSLTDYDDFLQGMDIQPNGKIVVSGTMGVIDGFDLENTPVVVRFNADGTLDTGFGTNGFTLFSADAIDNELTSCTVITEGANAGKIMATGHWQNTFTGAMDFDLMALRLNADGSPDATFGTNGKVTISLNGGIDDCFGLALDNGGNAYLGGFTTLPTTLELAMALVKLDVSGNLVSTFGNGGIVTYHEQAYNVANDVVYDQWGDRIGVAGAIGGGFLDPTSMAIWQFDADGNAITAFGTNGVWKHSPVETGVYELNAIDFVETGFDNFYVSAGKSFTGNNNDLVVTLNWIEHTESILENKSNAVALWPNPTNEALYVAKQQGEFTHSALYQISNSLGQICMKGELPMGEQRLMVNSLAPGPYLLQIDSHGQVFRSKFMVW